ncbi:MAG: ATP-binding protein [Sedimenticolaceae bacterium]
MHRLLRTSAIRLSLRYALLYILIAGGGLAILYWATSRYIDAQIEAGLQHHLEALTDLFEAEGKAGLVAALKANELKAETESHRFLLYVDKSGHRIAGDLKGWPPSARLDGQVKNIWIEDDLIPRRIEDHDGYWPSIATTFPDGSRLLIAQSVQNAEDLQEFVLAVLLGTLLTIIGLTLILGWRMGRQMLARIDQVNATAGRILGGNLDRRIPVTGVGDEFDELAQNLNAMLDHINRLIRSMRQVTDNVAHDLRRPLTRLRNRLDVTLLEPRDSANYRESLEETRSDIEEVLKTFNALLEIAQAESGHFRGEMETLDLSALARELGDMYADLFDETSQHLDMAIEPKLCVKGNRHLLAQLISNLLENAHKYAGDTARVELRLQRQSDEAVLTIADNGPGIPKDRMKDVLQRFVRLDTARSTAGNGLGLSLVQAVAEFHHAKLLLRNNSPGLAVSLSFPWQRCPPPQ